MISLGGMSSTPLIWKDRLIKDGKDKSICKFLRHFCSQSQTLKINSGVLSRSKTIKLALDEDWRNELLKIPLLKDFQSGLQEAEMFPTNKLQKRWLFYLSDFMSQPFPWETKPTRMDRISKQACELAQILLQNNYREQGMIQKRVLIADKLATDGMAITLARYDRCRGEILENKRIGMVVTDIIDPVNYFPDPQSTLTNPARAFAIIRHVPMEWLERMYPDKVKVIKKDTLTEIETAEQKYAKEDSFVLIEYYEACLPDAQNGQTQGRYIACANFETILEDKPLSHVYKTKYLYALPVTVWYDKFSYSYSVWGKSRFYSLLPNQALDVVTKSLGLKNVKDTANGPGLMDSSIQIEEGADQLENGKYYRVSNLSQNSFLYPARPNALPLIQAFSSINDAEMDDMFGVSPVEQGETPSQMRAAKGLAFLAGKGQKIRYGMTMYNAESDASLSGKLLELMGSFYDPGYIRKILGPKKVTLTSTFGDNISIIADPKNVLIDRSDHSFDSKYARREMLMSMITQGVVSPADIPEMWEELEYPYGYEAVQAIDEQKDYIYDICNQLLSGDPSAVEYIKPGPTDDLNLNYKLMRSEKFLRRGDASIPPMGWNFFNLRFLLISLEIQKQQDKAFRQQIALEQVKNFDFKLNAPEELNKMRPEWEENTKSIEEQIDNANKQFEAIQTQVADKTQ